MGRCSNYPKGHKHPRCKREAGSYRICKKCREKSRKKSQRWRTSKAKGRCTRCPNQALRGLQVCAACRTRLRINRYPGVEFDEQAYQVMRQAANEWASQCSVIGRSLFALHKVNERLSIDRIDPTLGYTQGNMRLIAMSLNTAKGTRRDVPQWAINRLLRRLDRVVNDRLSKPPA